MYLRKTQIHHYLSSKDTLVAKILSRKYSMKKKKFGYGDF